MISMDTREEAFRAGAGVMLALVLLQLLFACVGYSLGIEAGEHKEHELRAALCGTEESS